MFENPSTSQVEDGVVQRYLMGAQLRKVGDQLKAACVKTENEDQEGDGVESLTWAVDVNQPEPDVDADMDEYEEEIEEEEEEEDVAVDQVENEDETSWTAADWRKVKQAADGVVDVDEWDKRRSKADWKIKAPWAAKKAKTAKPMRTDAWGGVSWSDGWYKDGAGNWWPYLSNSLA